MRMLTNSLTQSSLKFLLARWPYWSSPRGLYSMNMRRQREKSCKMVLMPLSRTQNLAIQINRLVLSIWSICQHLSTRWFSNVIVSFRKSKRSSDTEDSTKSVTENLIMTHSSQLSKTIWSRRPTFSSTSRSLTSLRLSKSTVSKILNHSRLKTSRWPSTTIKSLTKTSKSGKRKRAFLSELKKQININFV